MNNCSVLSTLCSITRYHYAEHCSLYYTHRVIALRYWAGRYDVFSVGRWCSGITELTFHSVRCAVWYIDRSRCAHKNPKPVETPRAPVTWYYNKKPTLLAYGYRFVRARAVPCSASLPANETRQSTQYLILYTRP